MTKNGLILHFEDFQKHLDKKAAAGTLKPHHQVARSINASMLQELRRSDTPNHLIDYLNRLVEEVMQQ